MTKILVFPPTRHPNMILLRDRHTVTSCTLWEMFSLLLEKEPSEEDIPEEEEEEEEEEQGPDERTLFLQEEIEECFAIFDKKQTKQLEARHLDKALRCLGIFLTTYELEDLQETLVTDGYITYEKFHEYAFEKLWETEDIEFLKTAFRAFDLENEGVLPSDRVKRWMTTLGDPLTDKEAKELIKMGDPAGKGIVAYEDLVMILVTG